MMRKLALFVGVAAALSAAVYDDEKPSPIGHRRAAIAAPATPAPVAAPKTQSAVSKNEVPGSDTGTACFFRPKLVLDADGLPVDAPPVGLTAAHPTYPVGSRIRVTNLANQKSVIVKVTERSLPADRIISLSLPAAEQLGFVRAGTAQVHLEKVE